MRKVSRTIALVTVLAVASAPVFGATFTLNNVDPAGVGFNDPTPVAPVGGNPGTTLGEQRLNLFQFAADLWGAVLDSNVDIVVQATFNPGSTFFGDLPCAPTSAVLGAAGTIQIFSNFGAGIGNTWYHGALANSLAGVDLAPGPLDPGFLLPPFADDIVALFNDLLDSDPTCLGGVGWYYGFDNNSGGQVDLLNVLMHEFAHGLGFSEFASESTGALVLGLPSIYARHMLDLSTGKTWDQMTDAERLASQVNTGNLVWNGNAVTTASSSILGPRPSVVALNPKSVAGSYEAQQASFGAPLRANGGTSGKVVEVDDGTGTSTDGCEPIVNNVNGKIALIDRGSCNFTVKVLNAQNAGAKGAIVVNNAASGLPPMGGSDPNVVIPSVGVTMADGDALRTAAEANSVVKLLLDTSVLAGTEGGFVRLFAPNPVQPGSSKSHWDTTATPNLLMEPSITSTLRAATDLDLTPFLFLDEGWVLLP